MVSVFLLTFNCAKLSQVDSQFQEHLASALPAKCPDLLVFGFQELVSIIESTSYTAVDVHLNELRIKIQHTVSSFYNISVDVGAHVNIGAIGSFVLTPHQSHINKVSTASASCGMFYSSLKGAAGIRISYKNEEFTFCTAHLSANEGNIERRNEDYWRLVTAMDFKDGWAVFKPKAHTFFMGDLNYRAKHYNEEDESETLLNNDELTGVLESQEAFVGMAEEKISFKPTYKFHVGTKHYNRKRIPSWCDRILFQSYATTDYELVKYQSLSAVHSSDHEPVYLHIDIKGKPVEVVNMDGTLISSGRDMKVSTLSQYENYARLVADLAIGTALYCAITTNGRIVTGATLFLILLLKWYIY